MVRNHYSSVASKKMKKILAILMGLVSIVVLGSCSGDDFILDMPPVDNTPKDTTTTTPDPKNDDTWENVTDDWYNMINNYGTIDSYKKTNLKDSYNCQAPFSADLGKDLYFVLDNDDTRSSFISLENVDHRNTSYGEWYSNSENDSIREVSTSQEYKCNLYTRSLVVKNAQAYRLVNGQRDAFLMPTVVTSFAGHSSDVQEIERNDSIFNRETIKDSVRIAFASRSDIKPFHVSAKTVIDHFVKVKEKNENMPNPNITVDEEIIAITDRTATPIYAGNTITWYETSLVKTTKNVYVIVNGQKKDVWENSGLASVDWCNSAMYDTATGRWIPCHLAMDPDQSGWSYTFQLANGNAAKLDAPMNAALISSLKSFQKDDNAKQTPFLTQGVQKRSYSDGDFYTVPGIYTYTVAHK